MNKIFIVVLILLVVSSCSEEKINLDEQVAECEMSDLDIDELNKFSFISYLTMGGVDVFSSQSSRWYWTVKNDTIEVSGVRDRYGYSTSHIFLKKEDNCIKPLFVRNVKFNRAKVLVDSATGEVIDSGYSWSEDYDFNFKTQESIQDKRLVFKIGEIKVWIDFTLDIKREAPYQYEQYLR